MKIVEMKERNKGTATDSKDFLLIVMERVKGNFEREILVFRF